MRKTKRPIEYGDKARLLKRSDICRGMAEKGAKRDLRGWIIEFFGENTRAGTAVERNIADKIGIFAHGLELWSDDATITEQVRLFNEAMEELKVLGRKRRSTK